MKGYNLDEVWLHELKSNNKNLRRVLDKPNSYNSNKNVVPSSLSNIKKKIIKILCFRSILKPAQRDNQIINLLQRHLSLKPMHDTIF